jgi:hypothetical protein
MRETLTFLLIWKSWYGVEGIGFAEGVTPKQSAQSHPAALPGAVFCDCLEGILGTGWVKPATPGKRRRDPTLVETDQSKKAFFHKITFSRPPLSRGGWHAVRRDWGSS